jgi:dihydrodiol dehydrogenase / D-xylose 1-dehydrogenase (NADP)
VFIDLNHDAHITWTLKAFEAGKHVLCEKPLALNLKQVRLIVDKARMSGRFLMESCWSRFFPAWQKLREIIVARELGQLQVFHCNLGSGRLVSLLCNDSLNRIDLKPDTTRDLTKGEIPLLGIGLYTVNLALYVFGDKKPQRVDVVGGVCERGIDRWANITLHFEGNKHALLYYNSESYSPTSAYLSFDFGQIQVTL